MKILFMSMSLELGCKDLYCDLIENLIKRGHVITIVRSQYKISKTNYNKVNGSFSILNVKTGDPFNKNLIKKGLNQILLSNYFKKAIKKYLDKENFDLILYATPPVTLASVVKYCKEKYQAKTFLMLKDIFPQNAVDLRMMKKESIVYKYFRKQEKKYYQYSDFIGCMSQRNKDYVLEHNPEVDSKKLEFFQILFLLKR